MKKRDRDELLKFYQEHHNEYDDDDEPFSSNPSVHINLPKTLSVFFATLCVVDLFGVFPIVTLPKAIISCGFYGLPLMVFVISLQIYTAVILGRCWIIAEKLDPSIVVKNRYPYAAVAELTYGKNMKLFVTILLDVTIFGGGIPNLLVASQNLQLLGLRVSDGHFNFSFCCWLIIIGIFLCPIMCLGSPKNMKALASLSVIIVSTVAILCWYCIISEIEEKDVEIENIFKDDFPPLENLLKAYGIIAFQFDIHPMLLTIQVDMEHKRKIGQSVCYGIIATCIASAITTILAAWKYGFTITPNVLELLPRSWPLYVTIFLVTVQLCLSSAVGSSALFQNIEDLLNISREISLKRCLLRTAIVAFGILIAEVLPRFDLVMGVIGGSLTGPLIFILPPLFYNKIIKLEKMHDLEIEWLKNSSASTSSTIYGSLERKSDSGMKIPKFLKCISTDWCISIFVIYFGLAATITSTYFNLFNISTFENFWSPCLYNTSFSFNDL